MTVKVAQFSRAKKIDSSITIMSQIMQSINTSVLSITAGLGINESVSSVHGRISNVDQQLRELNATLGRTSQPVTDEKFTNQLSVPPQSRYAQVNFKQQTGIDGMEARLLETVQRSLVSEGNKQGMSIDISISGMGGVGKTTALIALGWQTELRNHFCDGIYFMSLGKEIDVGGFIKQLGRIVRITGSMSLAKELSHTSNLDEAVQLSSNWFTGKKVLLLCDDIWPRPNQPVGFLNQLRSFMSMTTQSCIVYTTRDQLIAEEAWASIQFTSREPTGDVSRSILFKYARISENPFDKPEDHRVLEKIMQQCAGIPLTLAVAGRSIASLKKSSGSWTVALSQFERSLLNCKRRILDKGVGEYANLDSTIRTSLQIADVWAAQYLTGLPSNLGSNNSRVCSSMFSRLCVMKKQREVSDSVLCRLRPELSDANALSMLERFVELNLISRSTDHTMATTFSLHDLVLDFCKSDAKRVGVFEQSHRLILDSYLSPPRKCNTTNTDCLGDHQSFNLASVETKTRPWWTVKWEVDCHYLFENLIRHLFGGCLYHELLGVVSHFSWTQNCMERKAIFSLLQDFENLAALLLQERAPANIIEDVKVIGDVVGEMWRIVYENPEELVAQMHARLTAQQEESWIINRFLCSAQEFALKPWIRALQRYWPLPSGLNAIDIPLRHRVPFVRIQQDDSVCCISGNELLLVDPTRRHILSRWAFPWRDPSCIAISRLGSRIAVGSWDGSLAVWNRGSNSRLWTCNQAHIGSVTAALWVGKDEVLISSGENGAVRWWDGSSGELTHTHTDAHKGWIWAMAINGNESCIVTGGIDSALRWWDAKTGNLMMEESHAHHEWVLAVAMCKTGRTTVSGERRRLKWWDGTTGKCYAEKQFQKDWVRAIAVSADGRHTVSAGHDGAVFLWIQRSDKIMCVGKVFHRDVEQSTFVRADGTLVDSGRGGEMKKWWNGRTTGLIDAVQRARRDRSDGSERVENDGETTRAIVRALNSASSRWVLSVDLAPNGDTVISGGGDGDLKQWSWPSGETGDMLKGVHGHSVLALGLSRNGNHLVSGTRKGDVGWGDGRTGKQETIIKAVHWRGTRSVLVSNDGLFSISAGGDGSLRWWRGKDGSLVRLKKNAHSSAMVRCLSLSEDESFFCSGGDDGCIRAWDVGTSHQIGLIEKAHLDKVTALVLSMDQSVLVSGGSVGFVRWWSTQKNMFGTESVSVEAGTDEKRQRTIPVFEVKGHSGWVHDLALSHDNRLTASCADDGTICVWKTKGGKLVWKATEMHGGVVEGVGMNKDGSRLVSVGGDGVLRMFFAQYRGRQANTPNNYLCVTQVTLQASLYAVAYHPRDRADQCERLVTADKLGGVWMHDVIE